MTQRHKQYLTQGDFLKKAKNFSSFFVFCKKAHTCVGFSYFFSTTMKKGEVGELTILIRVQQIWWRSSVAK